MKCTLDPELHNCPYLAENQKCTRPEHCSMQKEEVAPRNQYVRQPRWYEERYKDNKKKF